MRMMVHTGAMRMVVHTVVMRMMVHTWWCDAYSAGAMRIIFDDACSGGAMRMV
jgi:hypothetical protein